MAQAPGDPHPSDDLLLALHDNVLFPGDKPAVEAHLQSCARCRTRLAVLTSEEPAVPPPAAPQKPAPIVKPAIAAATPGGPGRTGLRVTLAVIVIGALTGAALYFERQMTRRSAEPVTLAEAPAPPASATPPAPAPEPPPTPPSDAGALAPPAEPAAAAAPTPAPAPEAPPAAPSNAVEILSPDRAFRWRIAGAVVERTTDGGRSWRTQNVTPAKTMTAGTAPSAAVCWIVGNDGAVLLGVGTTWKAVPLPQPVDLVKVAAIDATNATVTAADGRQFTTTDAGVTWAAVQP